MHQQISQASYYYYELLLLLLSSFLPRQHSSQHFSGLSGLNSNDCIHTHTNITEVMAFTLLLWLLWFFQRALRL